jgi:hypothetical protein
VADNVITIGNRQFEVTGGDGAALSDTDRAAAALMYLKQQAPAQPPAQPGLGQQFSQGIGAVKQWATAEPGPGDVDPTTGWSRNNPVAGAIRSVGRFVLPGSAPELVGQAALMGAPGAALGVAGRALPAVPALGRAAVAAGEFIPRTLTGMAASGGAAALTGESPGWEAAKTAIGSTVGTGVTKALGAAGNYLANRVNPEILDTVRGLWTKSFGRAVDQDVPAFRGRVNSPEDLLRLRDEGLPVLRGLYRQFENAASDSNITLPYQMALKTGLVTPAPTPAPTGLVDPLGRAMAAPAESAPQFVTLPFKRTFDRLLEVKASARNADPGSLGHAEREAAGQFEDAFVRSLPDNLSDAYGVISQQYNKGLSLLSALRNSQMFGQSGASQTPLEPSNLTRWAAQNIENFSPRQFPNVWGALSRGGQLGTTDVASSSASARAYTPHAAGFPLRLSEALPRFETMQQAGGQPVNPSYTAQGLQALGSPTGQRAASIAATPEALPAGAALALAIQRLLGGARNQ